MEVIHEYMQIFFVCLWSYIADFHNFLVFYPGEVVLDLLNAFKYLYLIHCFYTRTPKSWWGVYWIHIVHPSVCLSVCL